MINFCTLFDSNYLSRGLLLYDSLIEQQPKAHLFIFAFDQKCYETLRQLNLSQATVIMQSEFENETLLRLKEQRTRAEYCWTCTPWVINHVLKNYKVDECTYLDSDLFFFGNPQLLIQEMPDPYSVLITPHRYTKEYDQTATSGIYCVQFQTFRNNNDGREVLQWWQDACTEWCYNRVEDGKFGDQKYLDDWPERFKGKVWVLNHLGGGVAPWNVQQYRFQKRRGKLKGIEEKSGAIFDLIFFHFHACRFKRIKTPFASYLRLNYFLGYALPKTSIELVYKPYAKKLVAKTLKIKRPSRLLINVPDEQVYSTVGFLKMNLKRLAGTLWQN